jgi:hypothetical protein
MFMHTKNLIRSEDLPALLPVASDQPIADLLRLFDAEAEPTRTAKAPVAPPQTKRRPSERARVAWNTD